MNKISIPTLLGIVIFLALVGCYFSFLPDNSVLPQQGNNALPQRATQVSDHADLFCLEGCPALTPPDDQIVIHHIYELANNPHTKFADWVAYKISPDTLGAGCKRIWKTDPDVSADATLSPEDYVGARKALASDRGHQAPLASLCGSPYWAEADYLSNITPQASALNEGTWEHLENAERELIKDNMTSTVYSVTGPLYERPMPSLPRSHLTETTPSGYWKLISFQNGADVYAVAFVMDQQLAKDADYCDQTISLAQLEQRSHLHFFPQLNTTSNADMHSSAALRALHCS